MSRRAGDGPWQIKRVNSETGPVGKTLSDAIRYVIMRNKKYFSLRLFYQVGSDKRRLNKHCEVLVSCSVERFKNTLKYSKRFRNFL